MDFQSKYSVLPHPGIAFDEAYSIAKGVDVESKTLQQFKDEADINVLLARFAATGSYYDPASVSATATRMPQYGDYSDLPSYQEAQQIVLESEALFDALPSALRDRFGNDPANLLDFINNPDNVDEAIQLGILTKSESVVEDSINPVPDEVQVAE